MPFDSLTMAAAAHDLRVLIGGKINKIHQPDKFSLLLRFFTPQGNFKLLLSAHPTAGRVQLTDRTYANPTKPPLFCMVMRKHLDGAKLLAVHQPIGERVMQLDFAAHNEIGEDTRRTLILEVMGKHSNLLLIDTETGLIIDAIRRYSHNVSRYREVLPNVPYIAPPKSDLPLLWDFANEDELAAAMLGGDLSQPPHKLLFNAASGLSPYLAQQICQMAGLATCPNSEELAAADFSRLWSALQKMHSIIEEKNFTPVLLGAPCHDFYPLPPVDYPHRTYSDMSAALDAFYQAQDDAQEFSGEFGRLQKLLAREQQRLAKKLKLEQTDLKEAVSAEKYKNAGDLLTAYLHLVPPGATEVDLPDFYDPDKTVKIHLKPELSAVDNAKRFFGRYNKAKKAERQLKEHIAANSSELEYVESLQNALLDAQTVDDLAAVRHEIQSAGYLKPDKQSAREKPRNTLSEPRRFVTTDGFAVWLGRNNRQNDRLTGKMAAPDDLWFHTQKIPGSHVILRRDPARDFTDTAICEAAQLAAAHSRARSADKVPVDYTTVKNVKKPNGAKPGMVIYFEQQTLFVTPHELTEIE